MTLENHLTPKADHPSFKGFDLSHAGWVIFIFFLCIHIGCNSPKDKPHPDGPSTGITAKGDMTSLKVNRDKLMGRWMRPDGGYILEIRNAAADGKLDVGYFNPKPINVSRSDWKEKDGRLYVVVELQDVNYPGSTYELEYIAGQDYLVGTYYQAVEKSIFEVVFVREK